MEFSELSRPWRARHHSNPRGALLLCHGFTGSPQSMRPWAEDHAARGWDVELPLLPGHGTTWQQMAATRWQDWFEHVRSAALELSDRHGQIAVGGLSMGGALTLLLAADPTLHGRIGAIVLVNPGLSVPPAAALAKLIAPVVPTLPGIASDIVAKGVEEEGYERMPVASVAQLRTMFAQARRCLSAVQVPVLLATSPQDHTVPPRDSAAIAAGVLGPVERLPLPHSYHVATLDVDAPMLFENSARFLDQHLPPVGADAAGSAAAVSGGHGTDGTGSP